MKCTSVEDPVYQYSENYEPDYISSKGYSVEVPTVQPCPYVGDHT